MTTVTRSWLPWQFDCGWPQINLVGTQREVCSRRSDVCWRCIGSGQEHITSSCCTQRLRNKRLLWLPPLLAVLLLQVGRYGPELFDFSADRVTRSVTESLQRLQILYLDLIQCHDIEFGSLDQVCFGVLFCEACACRSWCLCCMER